MNNRIEDRLDSVCWILIYLKMTPVRACTFEKLQTGMLKYFQMPIGLAYLPTKDLPLIIALM